MTDSIVKAKITPMNTIKWVNLVANKPEAIWVLSPISDTKMRKWRSEVLQLGFENQGVNFFFFSNSATTSANTLKSINNETIYVSFLKSANNFLLRGVVVATEAVFFYYSDISPKAELFFYTKTYQPSEQIIFS